MTIEIRNKSKHRCDESALLSLLEFAIDRVGLDSSCELAITIVNDEEIAELNREWMGESGATDVLSFPMDEIQLGEKGPGILGDIVIAPEYAQAGAKRSGSTLDQELQLLTVHGLLHLLGLDHRQKDEEIAMFALQGEILREWRSHS